MNHCEQIKELRREIREIRRELHHLREAVRELLGRRARSATLTFINQRGEIMSQSLTVHLNDAPGTAVFTEFDGANGSGNKVPAIGPVTFGSDNPSVATVDASTGSLTYVSAGVANISGMDAGNGLTDSSALTVSAAVAVSATLTLVPGIVTQKV